MPLSLSTQHRKRVERLVEGVKAYALEAGIKPTAASRRVLNQSWELGRLEKGGLLSPETLEQREKQLKELRRKLKREPQAVSA